GGRYMRAANTLTPAGTVRCAHGSITVLTLGTTMPSLARQPSPLRNRRAIALLGGLAREPVRHLDARHLEAVGGAGVPARAVHAADQVELRRVDVALHR